MAIQIKYYFSPRGGCLAAAVNEIAAAKSEVLVQAYSFTADPMTNALIAAKGRGIDVEVLLDKSNELESYSDLHLLIAAGVRTTIDDKHAIAHNKVIVIDRATLITGSFNFTNQAEHENAENMLVIKGNPRLVEAYRDNFFFHLAHSREPKKVAKAA